MYRPGRRLRLRRRRQGVGPRGGQGRARAAARRRRRGARGRRRDVRRRRRRVRRGGRRRGRRGADGGPGDFAPRVLRRRGLRVHAAGPGPQARVGRRPRPEHGRHGRARWPRGYSSPTNRGDAAAGAAFASAPRFKADVSEVVARDEDAVENDLVGRILERRRVAATLRGRDATVKTKSRASGTRRRRRSRRRSSRRRRR